MEDKELQELFDAKRTVEANQRRQEQMAAMIGAKASPKNHRLWPLWITSAAAGIALLLITIPSLFSRQETDTMIVAQAPDIELAEESEIDIPETVTQNHGTVNNTRITPNTPSYQINPIPPSTPDPTVPDTELSDVTPASVESPVHLEQPSAEPAPTAPRIHRRSSTRLGSTNNTNTKRQERPELRQILADVLGSSDNDSQTTLKTFDIS